MDYYTYVWRDSANTPFYVGKGKGKRAHNTTRRSKEFKEVYAQGGCTVEIVDWFIHESQAHAHEVELIEKYGRREFGGLLVNMTDGGEGSGGWVPSAETRANMSTAHLGRVHTEEARAKIAEAKRGKSRSAETRVKISEAKRSKPLSSEHRAKMVASLRRPETRAKIAAAKSGQVLSVEARAKISEALRGNTHGLGKTPSAEARAKMSLAQTGRKHSLETRAKIRASNLGKKHSAETRERISAAHRGTTLSKERIDKISKALKGRHKSAEARAKLVVTNRSKPPKSGFKGVYSKGSKWAAKIEACGKAHYLGAFPTPEEAARAYDEAVTRLWGPGPWYRNFSNDPPGTPNDLHHSDGPRPCALS